MTYTVQIKNKGDKWPRILEETFFDKDLADRWAKLIQLNGYKLKAIITA